MIARVAIIHSSAGAAPHLPAGILSPYSDGERGAVVAGFANRRRCRKSAGTAGSCPADRWVTD
ncbi:hypothetical protein EN816_17100 [Mesorhizobium sp. M8A.F.Ca.ET.173.01.1.1]|nr:hypothetical protein EN816_17100 [Mesorhizobium sp. M8A.F.Ca.ET.173.01.1.1]TIT34955.1 MAG: hypothetical protein E5W65_14970 [Mesorhizobium sp.]TIT69911.1 MAG: hypothetical protein E5W63_03265 [Mesorhizobium sp.]